MYILRRKIEEGNSTETGNVEIVKQIFKGAGEKRQKQEDYGRNEKFGQISG